MGKIKVLAVRVREFPEVIEIENSLEAKQKFVGGYIEMVKPYRHTDTAYIICNEEAKLLHLDPNRPLRTESGKIYDVICGDFMVLDAPIGSDDFGGLSDKQIEKYTEMYSEEMYI